jgi:acyl-[acyl-carrier-protein]-phospholipid O-acyltransferase/long-chain-fatty-acid--[acyl-carrier-protein] ligase
MLRSLLGRLLRILCRVRTVGNASGLALPGPALIVANHPGALDPLFLAALLDDDVVLVCSRGAMRSRLCRMALSGDNVHTLDFSLAASVRRIARLVAQGRTVVVFPENRPTPPGSAAKLYEAPAIVAARSGVPILPVNIRYGSVGARGSVRRGVTVTVGELARIELAGGLPARERRRQATDRMLSLLQLVAVEARPRRSLFAAFLDALAQNGRRTRIVEDVREIEESYGSVLRTSLALGRLLSRFAPERAVVGVLLPNTVAAIGTLLGLSAMRRVPAMLNYSAGPDAVRSGVDAAGVRVVVTSRRFVEAGRLDRLLRALAHCRVLYLEDLRAELTMGDKLWLFSWALWFPRRALPPAAAEDLALVLFTSGSEGKPKGVALSHDAVLANMAQMAAVIDFSATDKFLNALPMYHTYGLIACTLMPILYGTKLFLYTNPLHYRIIPEIAYSRRCTYLFGTSTFLGNYARQARPLDFSSLRYVISGGEKLNADVQRAFQERFGLRVFEGYGATECGPAVSLATRQRFRSGTVGCFLPGVRYELVPVEGIAEGGVLHLSSPNMMMGYFMPNQPGRLQEARSEAGAGWYCMGDVVTVDADGYVAVLGRLKRFAKVAGEMVALELVERLARACSPRHQHAATVATSPDRGETTVLFTTDATLDRIKLHQAARSMGAQDLAVARTIVHVPAVPVLGSGKTDYVRLADLAQSVALDAHTQSLDPPAARSASRDVMHLPAG